MANQIDRWVWTDIFIIVKYGCKMFYITADTMVLNRARLFKTNDVVS